MLVVTFSLQSANAVSFGSTSAVDRFIKVTDVGDLSGYPGAVAVT